MKFEGNIPEVISDIGFDIINRSMNGTLILPQPLGIIHDHFPYNFCIHLETSIKEYLHRYVNE